MNISNPMINTIKVALDLIFKASGTDIRVHGKENVPDQPVLYVPNHFTRIETVMMPYVIKKYIKKYPISLADSSFFVGKLGEIMDRGGAVSTTNPNRDTILIKALLTDNHPVIIFPEGQMIKDKKIIEKGKYLINTTTGRRPPHTGAGRIALRSQFIREELRILREHNDNESIAKIAAHFGFDPAEVNKILEKETFIVPVNITYYPVRARDNAISRLINRFVQDVSVRMKEEMQVEGSMVMDGVDIDINLGKPIAAKDYLAAGAGINEMLTGQSLYLDPAELKDAAPFKKIYVDMMYDYMRAIYNMTTVNHDHLFSYIIMKYRKTSFAESDLKNRIYLAIEHLMNTSISNYHQTLNYKQIHLLSDDVHQKYENFVQDAIADNLISRQNGIITKNQERFSKNYEFHTIRQDNIIEVLKNEIEPLKSLTRGLDHVMLFPAGFIRQKIKKQFLELDRQIFEQDYAQHYIEGESKPENIGAPFLLGRFWSRRGVILVHGYMAAPEEIQPLAEFLYKKGYNVYGARLRGHGTTPEDLAAQNWEQWYDSVNRAYIIMKNSVKYLAIAGFSTGAGLALLQAANKPGRFTGVIAINGPVRLQDSSSKFSPVVVFWNKLLSKIKVDRGKMEFIVNDPENPQINYSRNPVHGVSELEKLMKYVKSRLKDVKEPTLVVQGSADPVVNPVSGTDIFAGLGAPNKQLISINADHHGILRGKEAEEVNKSVLNFLENLQK
jgi:esterase/lipase/1-acyl-sn-glycerol-3-phosphate acyltransferase